jgi:hypothetical protein
MPNHRGAIAYIIVTRRRYGASVTAAAAGNGECAWRARLRGGSVRDRTPGVCPRDGLVIGVRSDLLALGPPNFVESKDTQLCESILVSRSDNQRHV